MYSVFVYEIHEYLDLEGEQAIIKWFMTLLYDDDGYFRYISTLRREISEYPLQFDIIEYNEFSDRYQFHLGWYGMVEADHLRTKIYKDGKLICEEDTIPERR